MCGFLVPRAVFPPVGRGHLLPRIVEGAFIRKDFHVGRVCVSTLLITRASRESMRSTVRWHAEENWGRVWGGSAMVKRKNLDRAIRLNPGWG